MPSTPFIGEVRAFSFGFAPRGWALCQGQLLSIAQNQALFALLGTTYGGDGIQNFALPDLRGRVPMHVGPSFVLGQRAGEESVVLLSNQTSHTHSLAAVSGSGNTDVAAAHLPAAAGDELYSSSSINQPMNAQILAGAGGGSGHENRQPMLTVNYCIALVGLFPSRN